MRTGKPLQAPPWLLEEVRRARARSMPDTYINTCGLLDAQRLNTVCQSAACPNRGQCFSRGTATLMIMGNICTRSCRFCAVEHGRPHDLDPEEPDRAASTIAELNLDHVVITSVTRDDLEDGGASHFAQVIEAIKRSNPASGVEVLVPDFAGKPAALETVMHARPEVLGHNIETIARLYKQVRPGASYERSLGLLSRAARLGDERMLVKSGFMLGLGESGEEIRALLGDLLQTGCRVVTIGQYLAPSLRHYPVQRYVPTEEFAYWAGEARKMGFWSVASAPLVRSSFNAGALYREAIAHGL